jgi:hypothetical protein
VAGSTSTFATEPSLAKFRRCPMVANKHPALRRAYRSIGRSEMRDRQRHHIDREIINQSTKAANAISGTLIQSTSHIAS